MIVSHVGLKNWKNFLNVNVDLGYRVFLLGPNASGKSNFLDVFRFMRDIAKPGGGLQYAVNERGGISKIRCLATRKAPDIQIEMYFSETIFEKPIWKYSIGIRQESRGYRQPFLAFEKVWKNDVLILDRPLPEDREDQMRLTQTHLEQINSNNKFREISKFFESVMYMHLIPQMLKEPGKFSIKSGKEDPYGWSFLEKVARTPSRVRESRLKSIESALRLAVPQLKNFEQVKDENGVPHLEATYKHWRPHAGKQSEEQFSDGTLRLIGILWSLLDGDSLLLLEEPELSLHSGIVRNLPDLIVRLQRKRQRQVITSTHSADLLIDSGIGGEEVLILRPSSEGTSVRVASELPDVKKLLENGVSVADAVIPRTVPENIYQLKLFNEKTN